MHHDTDAAGQISREEAKSRHRTQEESTGHRKAGADRKSSRRGPLCFYTYIMAKKPQAFTISLKRHIKYINI